MALPSDSKIEAAHAAGMVTGAEASRICDVTYRRVDHMARTGVAAPTHEAEGSGTLRRYSLDDLVRLKIAANLYDIGVSSKGTASLESILDEACKGEVVRVAKGCITLEIDPACARTLIIDAYHETINPDPTED